MVVGKFFFSISETADDDRCVCVNVLVCDMILV
jgi:hypothetical protein